MHALIVVVAFVLIVFGLAWFYATINFMHWTSKGVTGPKPLPFLGNFKEVLLQRTSPAEFLGEIYQNTKGLAYAGFFILNKPALLVRDPSLIKKILIKDFGNFADRYTESSVIGDPLIARGLFTLKGPAWKQLRNHIRPTFTSGRLKAMFPLVLECGWELKRHVTAVVAGAASWRPATFDVKELMARASTDVITTCAFGINSNCISDPNAEFREFGRTIFDFDIIRSLENMSVFFLPWFSKLMRVGFLPKETTVFLKEVFWATILAREESKTCRNDMIDQLILLKNKGTMDDEKHEAITEDDTNVKDKENLDFSGDDLVAQAANFYIAGFETTSSTLTCTLFELAWATEVQNKVRQEVCEVMVRYDGQITHDGIQEMKYLEMVIFETLRKYPPVPFLDRISLKDYIDPDTGLRIEKGTPIYVPLLGLHYDPEIFPHPDAFDPERFSPENKDNIPFCGYLPFGEGPRICIAMRFAMMAVNTQLANLLSQLNVAPSPTTPSRLQFSPQGTLLALKNDFSLIFTKLENV